MHTDLESLIMENEELKKRVKELEEENDYIWSLLEEEKNSNGAIGQAMHITPGEGILQADLVYEAPGEEEECDSFLDEEWAYLGGFSDVGDQGLAVVDDPFTPEVS